MAEEIKTEETPEEPSTSTETLEEEKPLDKMTAPELRQIAKEIPGVTGVSAMKKDEVLSLIKKHRGIADKDEGRKEATDTRTLKQKMLHLNDIKILVFDDCMIIFSGSSHDNVFLQSFNSNFFKFNFILWFLVLYVSKHHFCLRFIHSISLYP